MLPSQSFRKSLQSVAFVDIVGVLVAAATACTTKIAHQPIPSCHENDDGIDEVEVQWGFGVEANDVGSGATKKPIWSANTVVDMGIQQ